MCLCTSVIIKSIKHNALYPYVAFVDYVINVLKSPGYPRLRNFGIGTLTNVLCNQYLGYCMAGNNGK